MSDGRETSIRIRVTKEEKARIVERAKAAGCTVSEFLRGFKPTKSSDCDEAIALMRERTPKLKGLIRALSKEFSKVQHKNPQQQQKVRGLLMELKNEIG